jgi:hypothetical protein
MVAAAGAARDRVAWHSFAVAEVCERLGVDGRDGLDAGEVERRPSQ